VLNPNILITFLLQIFKQYSKLILFFLLFFQLSNQAIALQQKASDDPLNLSLSEEAGKSSEQLMEVIK
jgi:hypothetical protein